MKIILQLFAAIVFIIPVYADEMVKVTAPPSIWAQQKGDKLTGPIVDTVTQIFKEMNVRVETKIITWARAIDQMRTGDIDIMLVIFRTDQRAQFMDFTIPYARIPNCVFVPKGKSFLFNKINDLTGLKGGMMRGDRISDDFERFESNLNMIKLPHYDQAIKMLVNHRLDYVVASKFGFLIRAKYLGLKQEIESLPNPISYDDIHIAFSKKSGAQKYFLMVNEKLKQLKSDGRLDEMVENTLKLSVSEN